MILGALFTTENVPELSGLGIAGIALWHFIRLVSKIGVFLEKMGTVYKDWGEHLEEEKRHHAAIEASSTEQVQILRRLDRGPPIRSVTGDHTPIPVTPAPPPGQ